MSILSGNIKENIIKLINDNLITPFNLVENARLKNYEYVKYYQKDNFLISEMKVIMYRKDCIFYYYFDKENKLQKIYCEFEETIEELFSREKELKKEVLKLNLGLKKAE